MDGVGVMTQPNGVRRVVGQDWWPAVIVGNAPNDRFTEADDNTLVVWRVH